MGGGGVGDLKRGQFLSKMKVPQQCFPVVMFLVLYKVILTFDSITEIFNLPIQIKATEHYFPVVLFIMLYKVVLTIEFMAEIIMFDQSKFSRWHKSDFLLETSIHSSFKILL